MTTNTLLRLCGAGLIALGAPTLYAALWGSLWQPGIVEQLSWADLHVLRPLMSASGAAALVMGLRYLCWRLPR